MCIIANEATRAADDVHSLSLPSGKTEREWHAVHTLAASLAALIKESPGTLADESVVQLLNPESSYYEVHLSEIGTVVYSVAPRFWPGAVSDCLSRASYTHSSRAKRQVTFRAQPTNPATAWCVIDLEIFYSSRQVVSLGATDFAPGATTMAE